MEKYDVIIAGASFAGLAVASRLKGRVLLLDRKEIGTNVTSACGSITKFVESIGCGKSILQTFDTAAMHTKNKTFHIPLVDTFCTIDYSRFCRELFKQTDAEFRKERVVGIENGSVRTSKGRYKAKVFVDCSGWSAVLASSIDKKFVDMKKLSVGVETELPYKDDKLRFFIDNRIVENGAAWLFPAGKKSRFGVASYGKNPKLMQSLDGFVRSYGLKVGETHGNFIPYQLRKPVIQNVFVVGDAVANVLPLTAEGIRPAIRAGIQCGNIIQKIIRNEMPLEEGKRRYAAFCLKNKKYYDYLLKVQRRMRDPPTAAVNFFSRLLSFKPIARFGLKRYERF